jgi:hypothetical protein
MLVRDEVETVVVTGNVTSSGKTSQWRTFEDLFAPFLAQGRLIAVPGTSDRRGDGLPGTMIGPRVQTAARPGVFVVRVDSTAASGLEGADLDALDGALESAPPGSLVVVALHHPPFLPAATGWLRGFRAKLGLGRAVIPPRCDKVVARAHGRCDLILHGGSPDPSALRVVEGRRPLTILGAGSSTRLGHAWVLAHDGSDRIAGPVWQDARTELLHFDSEIDPVLPDDDHAETASIVPFQLAG